MPALDLPFPSSSRRPSGSLLHLAASTTSLLLLALLAACGGGSDSSDSRPTIDVEPALEVPTENDPIEVRRKSTGLSGILPGTFPADVPLLLPASLVDYGEAEAAGNGRGEYVELVATTERSTAEKTLRGLLVDRGWTVTEELADSTPGTMRLIKEGRRIQVVFLDKGPGAHYRIVYRMPIGADEIR